MDVGIIAAMTPDGIIGIDGGIPWHYKTDMRRFKEKTMGGSVVFGSKTYASLPGRLPGRRVFVVSRTGSAGQKGLPPFPGGVSRTLSNAIHYAGVWTKTKTVWIGGGGEIYRLALEKKLVNFLDLTIVPPVEIPEGSIVTRFPVDLLVNWALVEESPNADDPRLLQQRYEPNP